MQPVFASNKVSPRLVPLSVPQTLALQVSGSRWVKGRATAAWPSLRLLRRPRTRIEPLDVQRQGLTRLLTAFQGVTRRSSRPAPARPGSLIQPSEVHARSAALLMLPDSLRMAAVASEPADFGPRQGIGPRSLPSLAEVRPVPAQVPLQGEGFLLWYLLPPMPLLGKTPLPLALDEAGQARVGLFCSMLHHPGVQAGGLESRMVELTPVVLVQHRRQRVLEPLARMVDSATRDDVLKRLAWQQPRELASLMLESSHHGFHLFSGQGTGREVLEIQAEDASWLARLSGKAALRALLGVLETGMPVAGVRCQAASATLSNARVGRLRTCVLPERMHRGLLPEDAQPELVVLFPRIEVLVPLRSA